VLFTEPLFFAFFALVFAVHWALRWNRARKLWLLAASYFFYAAWDWRFCGLILASTLIDYVVGLEFRRDAPPLGRRFWLLVSVCGNLALLGFFKYFNFFVESANSVFGWFGIGEIHTLHIILPVGISFYTFQTMSYTIDAYRRRLEPVTDFFDFALFVSFFPQLVMGPILRAIDFLPQLREPRRWQGVDFRWCLALFLVGFLKKACVSDNIAPLVDDYYEDPAARGATSAWMSLVFFAVQLYCDFSGYTDMAIAVAGLLGYRVARNFDFPLLSSSLTEFWRRWHISFSSWMRDYLYIPLGGSRAGTLRTLVNLMAVMLVSGLWHGAGWTFVTWGALNGLALVVERMARSWEGAPAALGRVFSALGLPLTFFWFGFTLIYFRAADFGDAFAATRALFGFGAPTASDLDPALALLFLPLGLVHWLSWRVRFAERAARLPIPVFAAGLGLSWALLLTFVRVEYRPFIYFQF
jgi:alginate O-acetyltransferase complex protein AlgI